MSRMIGEQAVWLVWFFFFFTMLDSCTLHSGMTFANSKSRIHFLLVLIHGCTPSFEWSRILPAVAIAIGTGITKKGNTGKQQQQQWGGGEKKMSMGQQNAGGVFLRSIPLDPFSFFSHW